MFKIAKAFTLIMALALTMQLLASPPDSEPDDMMEADTDTSTDYRDIVFKTINGEDASLADFEGYIVLLVNVASKCGYTPQYGGLEELYKRYADDDFVVIGFPANNFANQEPGTNDEILEFCTTNYGVSFPMMAKISVAGDDINPLYEYLTTETEYKGPIKWNFTKFLLDRDGRVVGRFESAVNPLSDEMVSAIENQIDDENATER